MITCHPCPSSNSPSRYTLRAYGAFVCSLCRQTNVDIEIEESLFDSYREAITQQERKDASMLKIEKTTVPNLEDISTFVKGEWFEYNGIPFLTAVDAAGRKIYVDIKNGQFNSVWAGQAVKIKNAKFSYEI
jgi:hypothetical protein